VKLRRVDVDARGGAFSVRLSSGLTYRMPFSICVPRPTAANPVVETWIDPEMGREGFVYHLASGAEGAVHADHVLHHNHDPAYLADLVLYELTVRALERLERSGSNRRALARRLHTTPARLARLLDTTNRRKSIGEMLEVLHGLDCDVEIRVRPRKAA